jgi:hypothetical protein
MYFSRFCLIFPRQKKETLRRFAERVILDEAALLLVQRGGQVVEDVRPSSTTVFLLDMFRFWKNYKGKHIPCQAQKIWYNSAMEEKKILWAGPLSKQLII